VAVNVPTSEAFMKKIHKDEKSLVNVHTTEIQGRMSNISPQRGTLSVIIRTYKAAVTTPCRERNFTRFAWHGRFYDHIIRDGKDLDRIRQYILDNPSRWRNDENFPEKIRFDPFHDESGGFSPLD
jgi:hypothetical protein